MTPAAPLSLRPRPRVLLADDHTLLVDAFERLLAGQCDVVGAVGDGRSLIVEAERLKPDVVVADISMPLVSGLDAGRRIRERLPETKLVFLTTNEDPDLAAEVFRIGASAFLLKSSAASELIAAIRGAMDGRSYGRLLVTDAPRARTRRQ